MERQTTSVALRTIKFLSANNCENFGQMETILEKIAFISNGSASASVNEREIHDALEDD